MRDTLGEGRTKEADAVGVEEVESREKRETPALIAARKSFGLSRMLLDAIGGSTVTEHEATAAAFDATEETGTAFNALFPSTPNIKKEPPKPDAHRGQINAVTLRQFDSGATAFEIALSSLDEGFDTNYMMFLPAGFVKNVLVDPNTLSAEKPVNEEGKEGMSEQQKYARTIRNDAGTGELEVLFEIAASQGRTQGGVPAFSTIEQLATTLTTVLSGTEVIFTRAADKNPQDPAFADQLRVRRILNPTERNGSATQDNTKRFKGTRKAWEAA